MIASFSIWKRKEKKKFWTSGVAHDGQWTVHYRQLYLNRAGPITFLPVSVETSGRIYDDFSRLLFLNAHREVSALTNELPEESDQFRFLRPVSLPNLKGWGQWG